MTIQQSPLIDAETHFGSDQVGLWLQAGFVEGVREEGRSFDSLDAALRHIFKHNLESAVLLWNAIPVSLDYTDDIPSIINPLLKLLNTLQVQEQVHDYEFKIFSKNICASWYVDASGDYIAICAQWYRVRGNYQDALNSFSTTTYSRTQFLCEWKLLLQQCIHAIADAVAKFSKPESRKLFEILCEVEAKIPERGRYYQAKH